MIVEGDQRYRLAHPPQPESCEMMKIAGTVKNEWCEPRFDFSKKPLQLTARSGEAQAGTPAGGGGCGQILRRCLPRAIEIDVNGRSSRPAHGRERKRASLARARRKFSAASVKSGLRLSASSNCTMACEVSPLRR